MVNCVICQEPTPRDTTQPEFEDVLCYSCDIEFTGGADADFLDYDSDVVN